MKKDFDIIVKASMLTALTCIATMMIKVPTIGTNGYVNIGDVIVLISAWTLGNPYGALAAGLGSGLADLLLGYGVYVPGTFVIKFLMAFVGYIVFTKLNKNTNSKVPFIISGLVAEAIMVLGYFFYEAVFLGYGLAASLSIFSNMIQGGTCLVLAVVLVTVLSGVKYFNTLLAGR